MTDLNRRERELLAELADLRRRIARLETKEYGNGTVDTFLELTDTPSAYTGSANTFVRVNSGTSGLTFGTVDWTDVYSKPSSFTPATHAGSHQLGSADPVGTATPTANAIPYADGSGLLDAWISNAGTATQGKAAFVNTDFTTSGGTVSLGTTVPRYSGVPTANRLAYWTGNGTIAAASYGTADVARYSGVPSAGDVAYWTAAGTVASAGFGTTDVVRLTATQTLTNKTLGTPTIGSFANATHDHTNAAGGGVLGTNALSDDAVTFAKMVNIATDSLIGRDTASTGDPENITLNATLSMTGSGALQRAALTGDVTASAGSNVTTIANGTVTNAKLADMSDATIKGRASGAGAGAPTDLTAAQVRTIANVYSKTEMQTSGSAQLHWNNLTNAPVFPAINGTPDINNMLLWDGDEIADSGIDVSDVVTINGTESVYNKTLIVPTIGNFANATHSHVDGSTGGKLTNYAYISGTPTTNQIAEWTGAGTVRGISTVPRYSGTPTAGAITYWTGDGTVAHASYGTADVTRYSGAPTAGQIAYWTAAGTVAGAGTASFTGASYPVILVTRTGSAAGLQATFGFKYTKSSAAADGDGPRMIFELNDDSTTTQNIVAGIGAARNGADNSADIAIQTGAAGVISEVGRFTTDGNFVVGGTVASARLHAIQTTLGDPVQRLQSTATNDDPTQDVIQNRVTTTNATQTTLHTFTIPASTTVGFTIDIVARRTGGTGGSAEDGAYYTLQAAVKNVAGVATLIGAVGTNSNEDQAAWNATVDVTSNTARVRVTGAANNNVTWHMHARVSYVSS